MGTAAAKDIDGAEFARILHPSPNWGKATVGKKLKSGGWRQWHLLPERLPDFLHGIKHPADWYMTPNEFRQRRCCDGLTSLRACWVDIDDTNSLEEVRRRLDGLPEPSLTVSSGRGFHVYWLLQSVHGFQLARWNNVQRTLCARAAGDPRAVDAARVLRVPQTINTKNGNACRVLGGSLHYYDFNELSAVIAPPEVRSLAIERVNRGIASPTGRRIGNLGQATLWEGRLKDLRTLAEHRWQNDIATGHRDTWLFIASTAISWLAPAECMGREIASLAGRVCPAWTQAELDRRMHSVKKRVEMVAHGQTIEWEGKKIDPRYRFRTDTIIDWLGIIEEEMRALDLRHLVTKDIIRERDRERKQRQRRAEGVSPRSEYLGHCAAETNDKRTKAREMKSKGHTIDQIARAMGAGKSTIYRWLAE